VKVLYVSPSFYPAKHFGGTTSSGFGLCNALAQLPGIELRVLTTDADGPLRRQRLDGTPFPKHLSEGYPVYYCRGLFGTDVSLSMLSSLWPMIRWADVVHLNAVYSPPTIPVLMLTKLTNKAMVWSTRGALQRWSGTTRKNAKSIWDRVCSTLCDSDRVVLHVTSEQERRETLTRINKARAVIFANGVDTPIQVQSDGRPQNALHLLYLGRLHQIKGIENLLGALAWVNSSTRLSICGDGQPEYSAKLRDLVAQLGLNDRVIFHGLVTDEAKESQFHQADVVVVPSFKEAFCMVVAEALAHGVPVIASRGTPWSRLEEMGCGLWVNNDASSLAEAITRAANMPRDEMGRRGREWMKREFSWPVIADQMVAQYRELVERNQPVSERGAVATRSKPNLNGRSRRYRSGSDTHVRLHDDDADRSILQAGQRKPASVRTGSGSDPIQAQLEWSIPSLSLRVLTL